MIKIMRHPNFADWIQVFSLDSLVNEFRSEEKAMREVKKLAREAKANQVMVEDKLVELKNLDKS